MKKSAWFDERFLPSLFGQIGVCNRKWLTVNQTAVCVKYMELHSTRYAEAWDEGGMHDWYTYEWRGRKIILDYSKKNGCGCIEFCMTDEESAASRAQQEAERKAERANYLEDLRHGRVRVVRGIDFDKLLKRKQGRLEMLETECELTEDIIREIESLKEEIAAMIEYKATEKSA